jgi:hypothetical protein
MAQADHVHFTGPGYRMLGDAVFRDVMSQYDIFLQARAAIVANAPVTPAVKSEPQPGHDRAPAPARKCLECAGIGVGVHVLGGSRAEVEAQEAVVGGVRREDGLDRVLPDLHALIVAERSAATVNRGLCNT